MGRKTLKDKAFFVLVLACASYLAWFKSVDPDPFFHLAVGRQIVEEGEITPTEQFCLVSHGKPFLNHEWLFDVALFSTTLVLGDELGLTLFKVLFACLLCVSVILLSLSFGGDIAFASFSILLALPIFRYSLEPRPHLVAYTICALFVLALKRFKAQNMLHWLFVFGLFVLWVNLHGSFILAFFITGFFIVFWKEQRKHVFVALLIFFPLSLLNPYGMELYKTVFHHLDPSYRRIVPEWKPFLSAGTDHGHLFLGIYCALVLVSFLCKKNYEKVQNFAFFVFFLVPIFFSMRFSLGVLVGSVPVLSKNLQGIRMRGIKPAFFGLSLISFLFSPRVISPYLKHGIGPDYDEQPKSAVDFALSKGISGNAFVPFHVGGFISYYAYPALKPFIDGRAYVHEKEGIQKYLEALQDYDSFLRLDDIFHFEAVIVEITDPSVPVLSKGLSSQDRFKLVYLDSRFALFTRGERGLEGFKVLRATTDPRYLFTLDHEGIRQAEVEIQKVLQNENGRLIGLLLTGVLSLHKADVFRDTAFCGEAKEAFERLVQERKDVVMFKVFLAKSLLCLGLEEEAKNVAHEIQGQIEE